MSAIRLIEAELPAFGVPDKRPELAAGVYSARLDRLSARAKIAGLDAFIVYADREHFANIAYLTGFEPRFEEALLILVPGKEPVLVTGPENQGYAKVSPLDLRCVLYPPFGLLGQDRRKSPALADVLADAGIGRGNAVGVAGWKYYGTLETPTPDSWLEAPSFIVDTLRTLAGAEGRVVNATRILMDSSAGLRAINEVDQLAQFEFGAAHASEMVKAALFGARPGMTEFAAARLMQPIGLPYSCHAMLSSGARASLGLASPSDKADYLDRLAKPYFACAAEWYETVGIGVPGGELDALVKRHLGDPFFGVLLNPGHLIHLDEWMNSPIYPGSGEPLLSGQAIQVDIIPATNSPYFTSNIEDGIALLDEPGRDELRDRYPEAWRRIEGRRAFMADVLGIRLKPEVLPFSNLASALPPFVLSPRRILARG